jgi:GNAT superfamily N-acetyltransferase
MCSVPMIEPVRSATELAQCTDDPLLWWGAQGFTAGSRAWHCGSAVAIATPTLAQRDRLLITVAGRGPLAEVAQVLLAARDEVGPSFRPVGSAELLDRLPPLVPGLRVVGRFGWMQATRTIADDPRAQPARDGDDEAINRLLDESAPGSWGRPGGAGIRRWWVVRAEPGPDVLACAAEAWSSPEVALIAGVASDHRRRGQGLGRAVMGAAGAALQRQYPTVALLVDADNQVARSLYASMGFVYRSMGAADWAG